MSEVASRQDVSRLFGRAAFGATPADLAAWTGKPYADAVAHLLDIPDPAARAPQPDDVRRLTLEKGLGQLAGAQGWWLERMRNTPYPLEERITLFWHDHFATGFTNPYPDLAMMVTQNQSLRLNALGNFRTMCRVMTLDTAMLYWLNGNDNAKGLPNENYAREFFELFTLGKVPQIYTEDDVRASARVLTGWTTDPLTRAARFNAGRHDVGEKVVLGKKIANQGDAEYMSLVDLALAQDVSPLYIAYKLVLSFCYTPVTGDLKQDPDPLVNAVAATLRKTEWNIKEAVRTLLLSDAFRYGDPAKGRQVVRQPVEQVVAVCKALGISADNAQTFNLLRRMGQLPFQPPNVGGWPFGKDWLSPVTMLARYDWGVAAFNLWNGALGKKALPASKDLDAWASMLGLAGLSENTRGSVEAYLGSRASAPEAEKQAGVLILIAASPDWMVI